VQVKATATPSGRDVGFAGFVRRARSVKKMLLLSAGYRQQLSQQRRRLENVLWLDARVVAIRHAFIEESLSSR
jgi:hypothetical protein